MRNRYKILLTIFLLLFAVNLSSCTSKNSRNISSNTLKSTIVSSSETSTEPSEETSSENILEEIDMSEISFPDLTFTYDGTKKSNLLIGDLPNHVSVVYVNNELTNAGSIKSTAYFSVDEGYKEIKPLTSTLTILKRKISDKEIGFEDKTFVYDGTIKEVSCSENLPSEIKVNYINNFMVNAGKYTVIAKFDTGSNFEEIPDKTVTLTISKATYDLSNISFNDVNYIYDNTEKKVTIDGILPLSLSVEYLNNKALNAGSYNATAIFTSDSNYNDVLPLTATLTILKRTLDLEELVFSENSFTFDETSHTLELVNYPTKDFTYSVSNNKLTYPGSLDVYFTFSRVSFSENENLYNYNYVEKIKKTITVSKRHINVNNILFYSKTLPFDGTEKSLDKIIDLPLGVLDVVYENNFRTVPGTTTVLASLVLDEYSEIDNNIFTALLTVRKSTIEDFLGKSFNFTDKTEIYSDNGMGLEITGTLPLGVNVYYTTDTSITLGDNIVTANFNINEEYEDYYIPFTSIDRILKVVLEVPNVSLLEETLEIWFNPIFGADYYIIYLDGKEVGTTTETTFIFDDYASGEACVVAVSGDNRSDKSNIVYVVEVIEI